MQKRKTSQEMARWNLALASMKNRFIRHGKTITSYEEN